MPDPPAPTSSESAGAADAASTRLDRGDVVNLIGRLRDRLAKRGRGLTDVQNRLIMKRLEPAGVLGAAKRPGEQVRRLAGLVAEVTPMSVASVEEELQACRR